jgi:hypothetical protein
MIGCPLASMNKSSPSKATAFIQMCTCNPTIAGLATAVNQTARTFGLMPGISLIPRAIPNCKGCKGSELNCKNSWLDANVTFDNLILEIALNKLVKRLIQVNS